MDKLKVVFVPRRSRIRPYKIAKALKFTGKVHLILVCEESFYEPQFVDGVFDEVHFFTSKNFLFKLPKAEKVYRRLNEYFGFGFNKMKRIIKKIDPDLIHCFAEPYNHIEYILKNIDCPVIMSDGADFTGITVGIENLPKRIRRQEQFCFENVDGIIYKGPDSILDYYRKFYDGINAKGLSWFDHADEDLFVSNGGNQDADEIHFVYTGNVSASEKAKYCYYIPLAKTLADQKIHFHVYPNPWQYDNSWEYIALDRSEKYFHFHKPLDMRELLHEISYYHYGLWVHLDDPHGRTSKEKMKTGMVNKMFTYVEAGLPVIVSKSRTFGQEVVESNNIGFAISDDDWINFNKILSNYDFDSLKKNVLKFRNEYSLRKKSISLYEYYMRILNVR